VILTTGMAHPRKLIRQAVVTRLTNATAAGTRVTATRFDPHKKSQLPAISVYSLAEPVDLDASANTAPREIARDLKIEIAAWVPHTEAVPVDDAMDDLAEQIEAAMDADPYLGGAAADSILEATEMEIVEDDARTSPVVGIITLTYSVTYRTSPAAPANLDDFLSVDAKHRIVGAVEANQARDEFVVQETPP
jgi:hypothetical protein